MAEHRLSLYKNPDWTVIRLNEYFERMELESNEARSIIVEMGEWCSANLSHFTWERNGVTKHSFRFQFRFTQDALAFKLRFGV